MPSVLLFPPEEPPVIGRAAVNRLALEPDRAIRSSKRRMGSDHAWRFDDRAVTASDAATMILSKLCDGAEESLDVRPERAVITVPAWFTQVQRAETQMAGRRAGLDVVRIINEPTAAALAHAHGRDARRRALVYDLGGGTFDVSLVQQDGPLVEVRASHGDTQLGGIDFDQGLVGVVLRRLARQEPELRRAISDSPAAQVRLALAVETAKIELSASTRTHLRVPFLLELDGQPRHLEMELGRRDLEEVVEPFLLRTIDSVDRVLEDGRTVPAEVDELLFVGGSTRMPLVWEMMRARYGLEGNAAVAPDRAVALGAAIQAAIIEGSRVDSVLVDVAPYSLSVGAVMARSLVGDEHFSCRVVTPRNVPLPSRHSETFTTIHPRQRTVRFPVFQGSECNPLRNTIIGEILVDDLPPTPIEQFPRSIIVEFRQDLDGLVHILVTDEPTGRTVEGKVVTGGEESEELREKLISMLRKNRMIPGDGSDVDPWSALSRTEDVAGRAEPVERPVVHGMGVDRAVDRAVDPGVDPGVDAVVDPEVDAAVDSEVDAAVDSEVDAAVDSAVDPENDPEMEEARATFAAVLEHLSSGVGDTPERAPELDRLAREGQRHMRRNDRDQTLAIYDQLTDLMFELGIYV